MGKYVIFNVSPRPKSNSLAMAERIKQKVEESGNEAVVVNFAKSNISCCVGCDMCKHKEELCCSRKDDLTSLLPVIDECDGMAFISPVYWGDITAQGRAVSDRMYAFLDFNRETFTKATKTGKKLAFAFSSGSMPEGSMDAPAEKWAKGPFGTAGFGEYRTVVFNGLGVPGSIVDDAEKMAKVDELADWLLA